jgi:hypothetical protein
MVVCSPVPTLITSPLPRSPGANQRVDRVVDEHEVAGLATVTGDARCRARGRRGPERGDDATVGALARAVHARERERGELDGVGLADRAAHVDHRAGEHTSEPTWLDRSLP